MSYSRRRMLSTALGLAGRGALLAATLQALSALRRGGRAGVGARGELGILRPPGSLAEAAHLGVCIRCTRCADACEAQCIRFFGPEAGDLQGTPYIDSNERGCTLCLACGDACPVGAIRPLADRRDARMGLAEIDPRLCVVLNGTGVCGACHTVCPLRNDAITLDIRNAPTVHPDHCVGCGLCEEACIVRDRRAIRVRTTRAAPDAFAGAPA